MQTAQEIRNWMRPRLSGYADSRSGEVNCTRLVEDWDSACNSGEATLDPDHIAWEIAASLAEVYEKQRKY